MNTYYKTPVCNGSQWATNYRVQIPAALSSIRVHLRIVLESV